jgi:hypothetical protein
LLRRQALPLITATATALAIAGCGGSTTLSTSQYESQGVKALNPLLAALNSLRASPTNPASWSTVQTASQGASDAFAKLKPPSSLASLNSQVASSLGAMGTAAGKLGTDISKHNVTAARTDLNGYQAALERYGSAITQLGSKGVKFVAR